MTTTKTRNKNNILEIALLVEKASEWKKVREEKKNQERYFSIPVDFTSSKHFFSMSRIEFNRRDCKREMQE